MLTRIERRASLAITDTHVPGTECLIERGLLRTWFILYRLSEEFHEARRYGYPLALAVLSPMIVGGETDADRRVRAGAQAARSAARSADLIGWLDGDDILVVLPHATRASALVAIERWHRHMEGIAASGSLRWLAAATEDDGSYASAEDLLRAVCSSFAGVS